MTKLEIEIGGGEDDYQGSKVFASLADAIGLSVDLTNFLITQFAALFLASLFRSYLHPSKVSTSVRHAFALSLGLFFGYFCFGSQAIHIAGLPAICYIAMLTQNPLFIQRIVMVVALAYLSCIHLHRQYNSSGTYSVDITGPLMIITQKVTSLAFSIHDGFVRESKELTRNQQYHMIEKIPSPLEYFSYVLNFQSLLAGPLIFYRDYANFIEGNIMSNAHSNGKLDEARNKIVHEPSPTKAVIKKVLSSVVCAYIYIKLINVYPIKSTKEDGFINGTNFLSKFWYLHMMTMAVRFKYYFAWLFADAIVNNAGLGFNGLESDGTPKWDLCTNIYVIPFELGTNFRDCISSWNIGTNLWLRNVVYERVPKQHGTALTFTLSALWHGFYPGYYMTFFTGAVFVTAARKGRRLFRHRFQDTELCRTFYDVLTCLITRTFMAYTTFPFVLLELGVNLRLYLKFFACLHLIGLLTIYVVPKLMSGLGGNVTEKKSSNSIAGNKKFDDLPSTSLSRKEAIEMNGKGKEAILCTKNDQIEPDESSNFSSSGSSSFNNSMSDINKVGDGSIEGHPVRKTDTNYLLKDLISKEVNKIKGETDNLSNFVMEKIEAANIEGLIDKTVNGIVELKDDLMRMNEPEVYGPTTNDTLRKRIVVDGAEEVKSSESSSVDTFLKKEIDAIKKEAVVLPAVLSNANSAK